MHHSIGTLKTISITEKLHSDKIYGNHYSAVKKNKEPVFIHMIKIEKKNKQQKTGTGGAKSKDSVCEEQKVAFDEKCNAWKKLSTAKDSSFVSILDFGRAVYAKANGEKKDCYFIVSENILKSGFINIPDLMKIHGNRFPEYISAAIFKKVIEAVSLLHETGFAFNNLGPENIFVGGNS